MKQVAGIEYEKDATGRTKYIRIDVNKYGENEAFRDFLDGIEVMLRKGEPSTPFADFVKEENLRRGIECTM